jgi:hypothetical protein
MTPHQFIEKWRRVQLSERSACQQHFCDLCDVLGHPKPAEADPEGVEFTFERGVRKTEGGRGWADVWKRNFFGWEYKGKGRSLAEAYRQLQLYREDLENPPLLVVCDMDRFEVHTNFTGTAKRVHAFDLAGMAEPQNLDVLRKVFFDPQALRPDVSAVTVTEEVAARFAELADGMRVRGVPPERAAHFLMKLMFCMFGEDIGLLPPGLFTKICEGAQRDPAQLAKRLQNLFAAMASGSDFGADPILRFNGGLFEDTDVVPLVPEEINCLVAVNKYDWASVEPSIFGTLFERTLDPGKRSQIGAHYTSRQDILTLLNPVLMAPLRREWEAVKQRCEEKLWPKVEKAIQAQKGKRRGGVGRVSNPSYRRKESPQRRAYDRALLDFVERLAHVTVLDPACGSGNFLYVAINLLLELEKEVIAYAASHGLTLIPHVRPTQLAGLEINPYARQLAQVVIWIGYLQWMHHNGFRAPSDPVLEPIESIRCMDAILDLTDPKNPKEPEWPEAEFIVGNPPFLGGKLLRTNLGDEYVDQMFRVWDGRVPREADLCCYWFEKARRQIERLGTSGRTGFQPVPRSEPTASQRLRRTGWKPVLRMRAGLLATQGIRGGANRKVVQRIKDSGDIFFAEGDREWVLDGANVHVSMVGFDDGTDTQRLLDGKPAKQIHTNLRAAADTTTARPIAANVAISFMGDTKGGAFDIAESLALEMLHAPNPHGRPNSDVVVPWVNGLDITRRPRDMWIIDFGVAMPMEEASRYEKPFQHVDRNVRPERAKNKREAYRLKWWIHVEARPAMRRQLGPLARFIATTTVSKHRLFTWMECPTLPDHQLIVFARCEDCFFGILHSRIHEVWARAQGTQVREVESGFRYTPTTCFETFPLPEPSEAQAAAIAEAARELDALRSRWLNPPEWTKTEVLEFPGSLDGPWARYIDDPCRTGFQPVPGCGEGLEGRKAGRVGNPSYNRPSGAIGTVHWPRVVPKDPDCAASLKGRTLTNLYNQRPAWLDLAHKRLDEAVFAAYGWDPGISDDGLLEKLLERNLSRAP